MIERRSENQIDGRDPVCSAAAAEGPLIKPRSLKILLAVILLSLIAYFGINVISHDQRSAAATAEKFAELAFVKHEIAGALVELTPEIQKAVSEGELTAEIAKMHPAARPTEVRAIEFEPMPGQKAMNIYLKGTGGNEAFYYRLLMVGAKETGYQVGGFWRGSGPYPPSARRPL